MNVSIVPALRVLNPAAMLVTVVLFGLVLGSMLPQAKG